ncbi:hypothetical protein [Brachybacterium timonense]|uniref:hypothetical protein n=1 Tax=Brachybacterium timonense TaxID=2050896 RepID=UPI000D0B1FED|nr:hypothetical protein [Brachybacterium timonense]
MTASEAWALPEGDGLHGAAQGPRLDQLRLALRPPELPLPTPRTAAQAATRIHDLISAERLAEAQRQLDRAASLPTTDRDRVRLARAGLRCARRRGGREELQESLAALVSALKAAGYRQQAAASAHVLGALLLGPSAPSPGGHRRESSAICPDCEAVVAGLAVDLPQPGADLAADIQVLTQAREAAPRVRDDLIEDPTAQLLVRRAQLLEIAGAPQAAVTDALDALELVEEARAEQGLAPADQGATANGQVRADERMDDEVTTADGERLAVSAQCVLARTLVATHPALAAHHAVDALLGLRQVDDPTLRVGLITDLLRALMAAGLTEQATFTAGRLLSLQRRVPREAQRTAPLLVVAAQRRAVGRFDAAMVPLEQARRIARSHRDREGTMEAARLAAAIHEATGHRDEAITELRQVAGDARWLADDLATPPARRAELVRDELNAQALLMRYALDRADRPCADAAAAAILRRTRDDGGRPVAPAQVLWDHRVDALIGQMLALTLRPEPAVGPDAQTRSDAGAGIDGDASSSAAHPCADADVTGDADSDTADAAAGIAWQEYTQRRRAVREAIAQVPDGHEDRARYWSAYLEDHHAHLLAEHGQYRRAQRAAERARRALDELDGDHTAERARLDALLERLRDEQAT